MECSSPGAGGDVWIEKGVHFSDGDDLLKTCSFGGEPKEGLEYLEEVSNGRILSVNIL